MPGFHFLPRLQSRLVVGAGTGVGLSGKTLYEVEGAEAELLYSDELPPHSHELLCDGNTSSAGRTGTPATNFFGTSPIDRTSGLPITTPYATTPTENTTLHPNVLHSDGAGTPHNNMMPYLVLNFIIKT